ncbi:MAG: HAD family hydrolase [Lachnospiraceae bacterium]|nr:HAD family hydrolase [Lachnospiraceae bacterium]
MSEKYSIDEGSSMNKALFLDRDGVINIDYGHVYKPQDFHFTEGVFDYCKSALEKGYIIIVITNQAGIAKGHYTEEDFQKLTDWMLKRFEEKGVHITKVYYCPYHTQAIIPEYKKDSFDRKPNPGMILKARDEYNIDLSASILVGDKESDIEAGRAAGVKTLVQFKGIWHEL